MKKTTAQQYAVRIPGPRHDSPDTYWRHPHGKKRAVFISKAEAQELADREGGVVVPISTKPVTKKPALPPEVEQVMKYREAYVFLGALVPAVLEAATRGKALEKKYALQFLRRALEQHQENEERAKFQRFIAEL